MRITLRKVDFLIVHHTAGPCGTVEEIRQEHKARGFDDIGYHALIGRGCGIPDGLIKPGRGEERDGAGVYGRNKNTLHVALIGQLASDHSGYTGPATRKQLHALGHWLLTKGCQYGVTYNQILGHKERALKNHQTACPGDLEMQAIRQWYRRNYEAARRGEIVQSLAEYLLGPEP